MSETVPCLLCQHQWHQLRSTVVSWWKPWGCSSCFWAWIQPCHWLGLGTWASWMTPLSLRCLIFSSMQIQRQTKQYYPNINVSHICSLKFSSSHIFESGRKQKNIFQFSSVAQSCPTLCDPMNCSTPGLPVHHQLPEFTQIHIHWVSDAILPSHPLSSPSPPAPNPSQHQSLFQWVNSSHEVAKVLEFQL